MSFVFWMCSLILIKISVISYWTMQSCKINATCFCLWMNVNLIFNVKFIKIRIEKKLCVRQSIQKYLVFIFSSRRSISINFDILAHNTQMVNTTDIPNWKILGVNKEEESLCKFSFFGHFIHFLLSHLLRLHEHWFMGLNEEYLFSWLIVLSCKKTL